MPSPKNLPTTAFSPPGNQSEAELSFWLRELHYIAAKAGWLLRPFSLASLRRWVQILLLTLVSTSLVFLVLPVFTKIASGVQVYANVICVKMGGAPGGTISVLGFGISGHWFLCALLIPLMALLGVPLVRLGGLRWGHLRHILTYPPSWVAALFGVLCIHALRDTGVVLTASPPSVCTIALRHALCILAVSCLVSLLFARTPWREVGAKIKHFCKCAFRNTRDNRKGAPPSSKEALRRFAEDPEGNLIPWLEDPAPILNPRDDCFDTRFIARRIAEALFRRRLPTVGLHGAWGSGKTTVLKFVEHYLHHDAGFRQHIREEWRRQFRKRREVLQSYCVPGIITCTVSAWGIARNPAPALVLRQVISKLSHHADCMGVNALPRHYLDALKGVAPSWLGGLVSLFWPTDPVEQLRRLDPILGAINSRLVVFIEDLDRNLAAPGLSLPQSVNNYLPGDASACPTQIGGCPGATMLVDIQGMLSRMQDVERVSFVLSVSRARQ